MNFIVIYSCVKRKIIRPLINKVGLIFRKCLNSSILFKAIPTVTQDSLQSVSTSPSMSSFRIKLELCHSSNDELIIYPKSTIISQIIIDGKHYFLVIDLDIILCIESVSQEKQVLPELLETNNTESNGKFIDGIPIFF